MSSVIMNSLHHTEQQHNEVMEIFQAYGVYSVEEVHAFLRIRESGLLTQDGFLQMLDDFSSESREDRDIFICGLDVLYFINEFCRIYNPENRSWIPFRLWDSQLPVLDLFVNGKWVCILKTRQVGITWLALAVALHESLFKARSTILIYSLRDDEAVELLSDQRFRGMYQQLPDHIRTQEIIRENIHNIYFANGSVVHGLTTTRGDSYTSTLAVVDEADLIPNLSTLIGRVQPAVEAGGRMILISRSDKANPLSAFKRIYRGAKADENHWKCHFLPWSADPNRSEDWYHRKVREIVSRTGGKDELYESYPALDEEALAPSVQDKRIRGDRLALCLDKRQPLANVPSEYKVHPDLKIFHLPQEDMTYFIGVDTAEGLDTSDNSALVVVDAYGTEVANLVGRIAPEVQARYVYKISKIYNGAKALVEKNNYGYTVIATLIDDEHGYMLARGFNGQVGWLSNKVGKDILYTSLAQTVDDLDCKIHDYKTYLEIQSIEKESKLAPRGMKDDRADAFALAIQLRSDLLATQNTAVLSVPSTDHHNIGYWDRDPSFADVGMWGDERLVIDDDGGVSEEPSLGRNEFDPVMDTGENWDGLTGIGLNYREEEEDAYNSLFGGEEILPDGDS